VSWWRAFANKAALNAWVAETITLCRERAALLIDYTDSEKALLDGVLDRGEIDASLLDVEPQIQARIASMPMLTWEASNVRGHAGPPTPCCSPLLQLSGRQTHGSAR